MINVLVVDDSKSVHAFVRDCIAGTKISLTHVMNGQLALDELAKNTTPIQLILLDWEMPVLDGEKTFSEIKKRSLNIPVVMMTSRNSLEDLTNMIGAGVSEYIMKPFTKDILIAKIESVLGSTLGS